MNTYYPACLHTHSCVGSLHDAYSTIEELVTRAKELSYKALAITEHGSTSSIIPFYKQCKKQGIKPIIGIEAYFTHEITISDSPMFHMVFLVKNLTGYRNLMKLNKVAHENFHGKPRIDIEAIKKYHEGLIMCTACIAGILRQDDYQNDLNQLHTIFGADCYIEIAPHPTEEQVVYNKKVIKIAKENNIKLITTIDSHYTNKSDYEYHHWWLNIKEGSDYYATNSYYLMDGKELHSFMDYLDEKTVDESFDNINEIIDKCNVDLDFDGQHYPVFCSDPEKYIRNRCNEGYKAKGIATWKNKKEHINRIKSELDMLKKSNYLNYMCIIDDMISWCNKNNIRTGLGRGSVCGSDVAYLMGITKIDPIKYGLVFERFCNPERVTPADIDTDVQASRRGDVIDYIKKNYGDVYQVRTFNYIKDNSAIDRAGQALGIEPSEIKAIKQTVETVDDLPDGKLKDVASHFLGRVINYGLNASAVIVSPEDITNFTSIERQTSDQGKTINYVVSYDFHDVEAMGLLKLDILALQHLDDIDYVINQCHIDYDHIPDHDDETCRMINEGHTQCVFQSEKQGMTRLMKQMVVTCAGDFILANALDRPGTLASGTTDEYIQRRKGLSPVTYTNDALKAPLQESLGLILYQEQVMTCARILCGYSLGQADNVRRIIGRKIAAEMDACVADMKVKAEAMGTPVEAVESFTKVVAASASYLFNKSHAAAYGITAWRSAWIKCHYPLQYFTALLNANCGNNDKISMYANDAKHFGITILSPELGYPTCNPLPDNSIRLGTNCIKGVGNIDTPIVKQSLEVTVRQYNKRQLESLARGGALDYFNIPRNKLVPSLPLLKEYYNKVDHCRDKIQQWENDTKWKPERRQKEESKWFEKLKSLKYPQLLDPNYDSALEELNVVGVIMNPFDGYDLHLINGKTTKAILVTDYTERCDKNGHKMAFVQTSNSERFVMFHRFVCKLEINKRYIIGLSYSNGKTTDIINSVREMRKMNDN